jgi:hypothetical protein
LNSPQPLSPKSRDVPLKKEGLNLNLIFIAKLSVAPLSFKRGVGGEFNSFFF